MICTPFTPSRHTDLTDAHMNYSGPSPKHDRLKDFLITVVAFVGVTIMCGACSIATDTFNRNWLVFAIGVVVFVAVGLVGNYLMRLLGY